MESIVSREAERASRTLFERAGDYVLLLELDPSGRLLIRDATDAAMAAHGYERHEVLGQPITFLDPFTAPNVLAEEVRALRAGKPLVFRSKHRRKDGGTFDVDIHSTMVSVEGRELIVSVECAASGIRSTQDDLRHMHDLMSYVISHARSAIAVHDRDLKYIYVSERYLKEYKVKEEDVIGRHHYDVFPDLPQKWRDVHQRALAGEVLSAEEDDYKRADGSTEWTRWECRPWFESDGTIGGIIVYTEVITDRKRAEDEKKLLQAELQQAMKMEAVGRLAGGVAHDFNNLLTAILGNLNMMLMDIPPEHPLTALITATLSAAESAAALTRQLLVFSRKQITEPQPLDVNEVIADLKKMLPRLIGEDIDLQTRPAPQVRAVNADPAQLQQVLVNLVVNARDAMPHGGRIIIETSDVDIDEEYVVAHGDAKRGPHVRIAVCDTGHGMSDEVKEHLFEPFFTTKSAGRGTGLGLASSFGAVKQAGGWIDIVSEVGVGSTVAIYLPGLPGVAPRRTRSSDKRPSSGNETILLVEDDERVRHFAQTALERVGYRVITAPGGIEALEIIGRMSDQIDLLITDVVMPAMDGRELARHAAAIRPDLKILFTSGYTENTIAHHGVLDPDVHFIPKPYTPFTLSQRIRDVLDGNRS